MKKDYKLIILDFDGTIADTNTCIIRTFNQTLQQMGYPTVDELRISNLIGLPLRQMYADILHTDDTALIDRAFHIYRDLFMGISTTTGVPLSITEIGPCLISPAAKPSALR